jgi:hypothetical protein
MSAFLQHLAGNWQLQKQAGDGTVIATYDLHIETNAVEVTEVTLDTVVCKPYQFLNIPQGISFTRDPEKFFDGTINFSGPTMMGEWADTEGNSGPWIANKI